MQLSRLDVTQLALLRETLRLQGLGSAGRGNSPPPWLAARRLPTERSRLSPVLDEHKDPEF